MSFELFEKLEGKVKQAVETIALLQMELEESKAKNKALQGEVERVNGGQEGLARENQQLKEQQVAWKERLNALLGRMEDV